MNLCIAIEAGYIHLGQCGSKQCTRIKSAYVRSVRSPFTKLYDFAGLFKPFGCPSPLQSVRTLEWPLMILVVPRVVPTEFRSARVHKASFFPQV